MARTPDEQTESLANYFPPGRAFAAKNIPGSVTRLLLEGLAGELVRACGLVDELRTELIPDETTLFIDEWESALGIPDDCFDNQGSDTIRRRNILAKLVSLGVQTAEDFCDLAEFFGLTCTIKGGSTHGVFPFVFPMVLFPNSTEARHTILIDLGGLVESFTYTFPLTFGSGDIALVKCLFDKLKPANCDILFMDFTP